MHSLCENSLPCGAHLTELLINPDIESPNIIAEESIYAYMALYKNSIFNICEGGTQR